MLDHNRAGFSILFLLAAGAVACSLITTGPGEEVPGTIIECGVDTETEAPQLVCVPEADVDCDIRDRYIVRAHCAMTFGGEPSDYQHAGYPQKITIDDTSGMGEETDVCNVFASKQPKGVAMTESTGDGCDDCRVCGDQLAPHWDDFPWCPDNYEDLDVFCGDDSLGPDDPDDQASTGPDDPEDGVWRCNGSWAINGTMWDSFGSDQPIPTEVSMSPPSLPTCVLASDSLDAAEQCVDRCEVMNGDYQSEANNSPYKQWDAFICADLYSYEPSPAINPAYECAHGGPAIIGVPMVASASFVTHEGGAAAVADIAGVIDVALESCAAASCPARVDGLSIGPRALVGEFVATDGTAVEYTLDGLRVELEQPLVGTWSAAGGLEFPDNSASFTIAADSVEFGGIRAGRIPSTAVTAELREARRLRDGGLELEFVHTTREGSLRLQVHMDGAE